MIFKSRKEARSFFENNITPKVERKVESYTMKDYWNNRVLVTSEHACTRSLPYKKFGDDARLLIGDKNTGMLARMASYYIKSGYVIPHFHRIDADASRSPKRLGEGVKYTATVTNGKRRNVRILIHKNRKYLKPLLKYHSLIENLAPKAIVSIHGMHYRRAKFDILLGFGTDMEYILKKKNAFRFRRIFKKRFREAMDSIDIAEYPDIALNRKIRIGVSRRFTGRGNYVLKKFIGRHNRENVNKRIGLQAEFSSRGRMVGEDRMPYLEFQIAAQVLARRMKIWTHKLLEQ